jgi:hypothetical protein
VILMLQKAHPTLLMLHKRIGAPLNTHLGRLCSPTSYARAHETIAAGLPVAADNEAFSGFDPIRFTRMLHALADLPIQWCVSPDIVANATATTELWTKWAPIIQAHGLPPAYAAQDGWTHTPHDAAAVFIGGTDTFKLGPTGEAAILDAHQRGLPVHVGRVNTANRLRYLATLGATSFDGTKYSWFTDIDLHDGLRMASAPAAMRLDGIA